LVLSRIDAAAERPRRTMKVASVVGRVFEAPILPGAYRELGSLDEVLEDLDALRVLDLVGLDREADQAWMFKHMVTQEVTYESLPFALRGVLHGLVGDYIERTEAEDLERHVPLLEHHYWRSDREDKKREYLRRAAELAQASYANNAAIAYYERLIPLLEGSGAVEEAIRFGEVLQLVGNIARAEAVVSEARDLAVRIDDARAVARCDHSLAESARRLSRFDEAIEMLAQARAGFQSVGDDAGVADTLQVAGNVRSQRGDAEGARAAYEAGLEIRERLGIHSGVAALLNNLGIAAIQLGDMAGARGFAERALRLYTDLGDHRRIVSCEINLGWMDGMTGDHPGAIRHCQEAIRLATEVGDRLNLANAQNNLGDALRDMGRLGEAGSAYAAAAEAYRDVNELWSLMALLEDVSILSARAGRPVDAFTLLGAADALRVELGAARPPAREEEIAGELATARAAVGELGADGARDRGRELGLEAALDLTISSAAAASPA
jgi:tetratricopeptide (TPR) repeat protein